MFSGELQRRLELLNKDLIVVADQEVHLKENSKEGFVDLTLRLQNKCIVFKDLEHRKLEYFENKKCADYLMYEQKGGQWLVHIFELKRSVGESEWGKIKLQFKGAMQNALAIAGFLDITVDLEGIYVYTVYRNDKLNHFADPVRLRCQMYRKGKRNIPEECKDWNGAEAELDFLGKKGFAHKKISLDVENGTGKYAV